MCIRDRQGSAEPAKRFTPTKATLQQLPGLDKLEQVSVACLGKLAYDFFILMFPLAIISLLVNKVRKMTVGCRRRFPGGLERGVEGFEGC